MFFRFRREISRWWFDVGAQAILNTPALNCRPDGQVTVVTQIYPPDVMMYLVAIKTFARFVPIKSVVVVGDRLTPRDQALIRAHVRPVELVDIQSVNTQGMPHGGTWERLLTILGLSASTYTIQLDADTITRALPNEVLECIAVNRSFTLGTAMGRFIISAQEASAAVKHLASKDAHVQIAAEVALSDIAPQPAYYVRGNSAFAGFGHGAHRIETLQTFSQQMVGLLGVDKWNEWGSEQVASNFMIANSGNPLVLPFDRYRYFHPDVSLDSCQLIHFMGTYRFARGAYRRLARKSISSLLAT